MAEFTYPTKTNNMHVKGIYERYQLMINEVSMSLTKETTAFSPHDANRWLSYTAGMRVYLDYVQSTAILDFPVTKGREYPLTEPITPVLDLTDNLGVGDLTATLQNARDEVITSASTEMPSHLIRHDEERQRTYLDAIDKLIKDFMQVVQPVDGPIISAQDATGQTPSS